MTPATVESGGCKEEVVAQKGFKDPGVVPNPVVEGVWTPEKIVLLTRKPVSRDVHRGESIADHMYRMSLMSMLAPPTLAPRLDLNKCIKMCLIHDMAESLVGDITPVDGVAKPEKARREAATMDYITSTLLGNVYGGGNTVGAEMRAIWQEYEDSETLESKYVHDIDKMELICQMVEYEKRGEGRLDLGEFAWVAKKMVLPEMIARGEEILKEREAFWAGRNHVRGDVGVEGGVSASHIEQSDAYYSKPEEK
ncbi:HD domain-containing protein [Pyricularia oryzae Y34]|uniref:5'-deoxynucleotidase n=2 Tax=Pyricularia oryzae TaxID=318829 RepID=A0AA97PGA6_PYRO3|nr:HD domain-containing protein [Pyricularia oryzae Y34]